MKEIRVSNFKEFHEALSPYRKSINWSFRGHADPSWQLVPKAGREPFSRSNDKIFFQSWKRRAVELVSSRPLDDWDWLTIAQNHGLATRLLDWTSNPLAAAFFAVEPELDSDAVIVALDSKYYMDTDDNPDPFNVKGVSFFFPRGVVPRLVRQGGVFTIHNPPTMSVDQPKSDVLLERIIIDRSYVRELRFELSNYGINRMTLFPDLDGLSSLVNWYIINKEYWRGSKKSKNQP